MGKEEIGDIQETFDEITKIGADQMKESKAVKQAKDSVEARKKGVTYEQHLKEKYGTENYDYGKAEEERREKLAEMKAKEQEYLKAKAEMDTLQKLIEDEEKKNQPPPVAEAPVAPAPTPEATTTEQPTT